MANQLLGITQGRGSFLGGADEGAGKTVFLTAVFFVYIFNLELAGGGGVSLSSLIVLLVCGLPFYPRREGLSFYVAHGLLIVLLFLIPFLWTAAYAIYYATDAIVLTVSAIKTFIWAWIVALVLFYSSDRQHSFRQRVIEVVLIPLVAALFLQSIFVLLSFFIPGFSEWVGSVLVTKGNLTGLEDFRSKGFANSGGANMAMVFSFGVVASITLFHYLRQSRYLLIAFFITLTSALVGRSGVVAGIALLMLYYTIYGSKVKLTASLGLCVFAGVLFLASDMGLLGLFAPDSAWMKWFFTEASESVTQLSEMIGYELSGADALFGAGFFEEATGQYERSDSGFVKSIYALGIPMAIYFYGIIFYIFSRGLHVERARSDPFLTFLLILISLMLFAFEMKECMLCQNMTGRVLFLLANIAFLFKLECAAPPEACVRGNG